MREGVLHIRDVQGPKKDGSEKARLEAVEQEIFKCQGMVERGLSANHFMITEFIHEHKWDNKDVGGASSSFKTELIISKRKSLIYKIKIVSMSPDLEG
jgi:hypothetical protein